MMEEKKYSFLNAKECGLKSGIKQGIIQRNLEIAKNLLKQDININAISIATGLNIDELQKIDVI